MIICIPSIRHSGTRQFTKVILKEWNMLKLTKPQVRTKKLNFYCGHVEGPTLENIQKFMQQYLSLAPMRHPARIWKSFADRNMTYDFYFEHFANMIELYNQFDIRFVHVDDEINRDLQLKAASDYIGIPLKSDWPEDHSVMQKGNAWIEVTDYMRDMIPNVIVDFYTSIGGKF